MLSRSLSILSYSLSILSHSLSILSLSLSILSRSLLILSRSLSIISLSLPPFSLVLSFSHSLTRVAHAGNLQGPCCNVESREKGYSDALLPSILGEGCQAGETTLALLPLALAVEASLLQISEQLKQRITF